MAVTLDRWLEVLLEAQSLPVGNQSLPVGMALRSQDLHSIKDEELGAAVNEKAVIRKLNQHILLKFFLMCILCYIGRVIGFTIPVEGYQ